jgi:protein tyrosine/serine phosphatase
MTKAFRASLLTLMAVISFAMIANAQTSPSSNFPGISIRNFGQMTDNLYRGGQPSEGDYRALAAIGIKTIVDLRSDHETWAKADAEAAGLKYVLIPMNGVSAPTDEQVAQFLQIANDPASGKVYFHCKAGIHRTGAMGAAYRISHDGWDYGKTYAEMKNYQFSAGLFHGALKSFVEKFAAKNVAQRSTTVAAKTATATAN